MDRNAIFWAGRLVVGGIGILLVFRAVRVLGRARAAANWPTAAPVATLARPLGWAGIGAGLLGLAAASALSLGALAGSPEPELTPRTWRGWLVAGVAALVVLAVGASMARRLVNRAELTALIRTPPRPGPASQATGPETQNTGPARPDTGPAKPDTGPAKPDTGPARQDLGPAGQGTGPVGQDTGPERQGTGPGMPDVVPMEVLNPPVLALPAVAFPTQGRAAHGRPAIPAGATDPAVPADGQSGWVYRDPAGDWYLAVATTGGQRLVRLTDFTLVPVGTAGSPLALAGSVEISVWPVTDRVANEP